MHKPQERAGNSMIERIWRMRQEIVVLIAVPLAYLLLGPFQLYPPPGWVDPGMYLAYFIDLPGKLAEFGPNYHAMRLPFTLSGFVLHRVFPVDLANDLFVLAFYFLGIWSLYFAIRARHDREVATATALFLALNPLWIAAVTRTYVDGPGMAFGFACLSFLANRGGSLSFRTAEMLAGVAAVLAACCNIAAGIVTMLLATAWLAADQMSWRGLLRIAGNAFAGAAATIVVLGTASRSFGGPFLFFSAALDFGTRVLRGFGSNYRVPLHEWMPSAYRLALPVAFLGIGIGVLATQRSAGSSRSLLWTGCIGLGLTAAFLLLFDFGIGATMLQSSFYASYLIPGQCFVFGGLAARLLRPREGNVTAIGWFGVAAGMIVAAIVPLLDLPQLWALELGGRHAYVFWFLVILAFLISLALMHRGAGRSALVAMMFATVFAATANADTRRIFRVDGNPDYKVFYGAMMRIHGIVESTRSRERTLFIWYCRECVSTGDAGRDRWLRGDLRFAGRVLSLNFLDSVASLWLWNTSWLNPVMPSLPADDLRRLTANPRGSTLVLLCTRGTACADALANLHAAGVVTRERASVPIAEGDLIDLRLVVLETAGSAKH